MLTASELDEPEDHPLRHTKPKHYLVAALIGLAVGIVAVVFRIALHHGEAWRLELLTYLWHHHPYWGWMVLPMIGAIVGLIVGALLMLAPEAGGSGIPHIKAVMLGLRHLDSRRLIPVKFVGGVLGTSAGLSLGREGPTVQMGAALAQQISTWTGVSRAAVPQMLSAGAGAGLAAAFNAPLAGLIFVIEELHRELSTRTFVGALIASIVATSVTESISGQFPALSVHNYPMLPLWALPGAALIGIVGGVAGAALNAALLGSQKFALRQRVIPRFLLPALAGGVVGLVAWRLPHAVGGGHVAAQALFSGELVPGIGLLVALFAVRFVLTIGCYASGAPGGVFAPMLLMGAILGTALGRAASHVFPTLAPNENAFAVLGMAAIFTGSIRAPLTGIVLICEMTGNYQQLFAVCISCLCAHIVADLLRAEPMYDALMEADLHQQGIAPAPEARSIYVGIETGSRLDGAAIREAGWPRGTLVAAIERSGKAIAPVADVELRAGDHLVVTIAANDPSAALKIIHLCQDQS